MCENGVFFAYPQFEVNRGDGSIRGVVGLKFVMECGRVEHSYLRLHINLKREHLRGFWNNNGLNYALSRGKIMALLYAIGYGKEKSEELSQDEFFTALYGRKQNY